MTRHHIPHHPLEAEAADLSKAIQGLKDAIKAMKSSRPSLVAIRQTVGKTFQMAEAWFEPLWEVLSRAFKNPWDIWDQEMNRILWTYEKYEDGPAGAQKSA